MRLIDRYLLRQLVGPVALATAALAMVGGCRLVRTSDVRSARRVVDTLAAVMEAQ